MDAIAIAIGGAAAKFALRLWAREPAAAELGSDVLSIFGTRLQGEFAQREVRRQFERMAEQLADRLTPFLSSEVGGIASNERAAAALAAQASLDSADALDLQVLMSLDLDSARLTKWIRTHDPDAVERAGLSEAASGLYDTLIAECASYITTIATQLPGYASREAQELLGRHSRLSETALDILNNLPPSIVPREWGAGSEDQRFENKYRHAVREYSEQLQLFGVVPNEARRPYPLSVAYISMAVDERRPGGNVDLVDEDLNENSVKTSSTSKDAGASPDLLRVEALLEDADRLLLIGGAGSGKTTLIQWIALAAVAGATSAMAPANWSDRVPFIIPLRRFVGKALPTPKQFVEQIAPNLSEAMPPTWVHRVLASGRGAVLIDGLDEIPGSEREDARQWVLGLIRDFPTNRFLVTSRSTAITKGWRDDQNFRQGELLPMEFGDIRAFIAHWHQATRQAVDPASRDQIVSAERGLLGLVRDRPAIRALCTSPLLCALICALHLQNAASLPNNRMDVYRTALEMLIHKRDSDRRVSVSELSIDYTERRILLQSFAAWLHENGSADATRAAFDDRVARTVDQLHRVKGDPEEVASFMLERSGVLREPVAGRVDFVHRTFLEFLAASAIVDDDSIDKLVRAAHDDHWREVIILAAGHANNQQRDQLIRGILQRGTENHRKRHRFFLLAVACMETSPRLSPDLSGELAAALAEVLPPRNMSEALAVASAGELAVQPLQDFAKSRASVAAASVRALSLIGGESAMKALEFFRDDRRVTVTRQLIRAWSSFDTAEYAARVLANCALDRGHITLTDSDQITYLPILKHAQTVFVSLPRRFDSVADLPALSGKVYGADVSGIADINSLTDLPFSRAMTSLSVRNSSLTTLDGADEFADLHFLSVSGNARLQNTQALANCTNLKFLSLSGTGVEDLSVGGNSKLDWLEFHAAGALKYIREPVNAASLHVEFAPELRTVSGLADSPDLRMLRLHLAYLESVDLPAGLTSLGLVGWGRPITPLGGEALTHVSLHSAVTPEALEWICALEALNQLTLQVREDEIGGWSAKTAIAEVCARSSAKWVSVAIPYGQNVDLPEPSGWRRVNGTARVYFTRT